MSMAPQYNLGPWYTGNMLPWHGRVRGPIPLGSTPNVLRDLRHGGGREFKSLPVHQNFSNTLASRDFFATILLSLCLLII